MAEAATGGDELAVVVDMMLGELNGSHLRFEVTEGDPQASGGPRSGRQAPADQQWIETTAHLGLRFERNYRGPGCKVRDVIAGSPADHVKTKILPGEIVLSIDGKAVGPDPRAGAPDLTRFLNGPPHREVRLKVRDEKGRDRDVQLRVITYDTARSLLYEQWIQNTERKVADGSANKLGYLRIRSMDMPSFYKFERDLYSVGLNKEGLIINVRENGGGFTTDHLLTALTQPVHAITVPRGGEEGYPQDRKVYVTWNKPIVVLCNEYSFSDAEIFAHADQDAAPRANRGRADRRRRSGHDLRPDHGRRPAPRALPRLVPAGRRQRHGAQRRSAGLRDLAGAGRDVPRQGRAVGQGDRGSTKRG